MLNGEVGNKLLHCHGMLQRATTSSPKQHLTLAAAEDTSKPRPNGHTAPTLTPRAPCQYVERNNVSSPLGFHRRVDCMQPEGSPYPRLRHISHYRLQNERTAFIIHLPPKQSSTCGVAGKLAGKMSPLALDPVATRCSLQNV